MYLAKQQTDCFVPRNNRSFFNANNLIKPLAKYTVLIPNAISLKYEKRIIFNT